MANVRETTRQAAAEGNLGRELSQKAQELTTQGKEIAADYYEQGREQVLTWQRQLEKQVRAKPMQALLIAGGVGVLLGLLRRR